ncbi:MAG: C39 family peptidase [Deltaproteobacteria bacterium]|jgi:hypothetical protein|nr:C39 family peptidase [Deltaproteobacteria bacterium]
MTFSYKFVRLFLIGLSFSVLSGCFSLGLGKRSSPAPFNSPDSHRLIAGVPFYPDETNLCGPASIAAVMTFLGRPTEVSEAAEAVQRTNLRGSLAPDLTIWARSKGFKAKFWAAKPEEILRLIDLQNPVILQINSGLMGLPVKTGHFVVAVGYGPEGLVANSGVIQQEIIPWSDFLTRWYSFGNIAILVELPDSNKNTGTEESSEEQAPADISPTVPVIVLDTPS